MPETKINLEGLSEEQLQLIGTIVDFCRRSNAMDQMQAREEFGRIWDEWKVVASPMNEDEVAELVEEAVAWARST